MWQRLPKHDALREGTTANSRSKRHPTLVVLDGALARRSVNIGVFTSRKRAQCSSVS